MNTASAKRSTPSATPTPIPADAPTDKPVDFACNEVFFAFEVFSLELDVGFTEVVRDVEVPEVLESV
jgi:hypothetical protein